MFEVQVQLLIAIPVPNNEANSSSMTPKSGRLSTEHTVFHGCPCADCSAIHLFSKKYPVNVVQCSLHSLQFFPLFLFKPKFGQTKAVNQELKVITIFFHFLFEKIFITNF